MREPDNSLPADVRLIVGSTGSGKSFETKRAIARERNVFVFDVKNEYGSLPGFRRAYTRADFLREMRRGGRVAWATTGAADFEFFCWAVWYRGSALVIVEELASVTGTGKAIGPWHLMLSQGRGFGLRIIGVTQRPAEIDKTIVGNATLIRAHRLTRGSDRAYVAAELDVPRADLDGLQGFDYIERCGVTGRLRYSAGKSAQKAPRKGRNSL